MMDYSKKPGRKLEKIGEVINSSKPTISIVTPYYNAGSTIDETSLTVFSQTYPFFEWIIVDDGSKDKDSLEKLKNLEKKDKRIKVFHKDNGGPSVARDFGIEKTDKNTKYVYFLDADDLIDKTTLECLYWSLETHPDASFAYTTVVNFQGEESLWEKYLTVEHEKVENLICISSLVRKEDLIEVGCFGIKEKAMYEDWNLWLKLIKAGKKPLRVSAPLFWYRKTNTGELSRAMKNNENAMRYVNETAKQITKDVEIIQYPRCGEKYATVKEYPNMILPEYKKDKRKTILYLFPWMVFGGADIFNLELIRRTDKTKYRNIVLTTTPNENPLRQDFEDHAEVYDMSTFIDRKDYLKFADYIISSRKVDLVFISNSEYGYYMTPYLKSKYPHIPFIDYIHCIDIDDKRKGFARCSKDIKKYLSRTYCCNNATLRELKEDFDLQNAETIYIGTDEKRFNPKKFNKKQLRDKYNLPQDKIIITVIARLADQKRPEMFVEIAKRIYKKNNNVYFVIGGDGPLMSKVKAKIDENFRLLGAVKETEEIYALSDLTINCSTFEGLALTSYESLAMELPVISTDAGGQTELIDDKVGGIVHFNENPTPMVYDEEINEYVEKTLNVIENLDEIKKNCRKRIVEGFTLDLMVKKFEKIYEEVINEEKDKKLELCDYTSYELAMENFHQLFYFYCKDYIERKFDIYYDENESVRSKGRFYALRVRIVNLLNRAHAKEEAQVIKTFFQHLIECTKEFFNMLKYFFLSIPAGLKMAIKILLRNHNK